MPIIGKIMHFSLFLIILSTLDSLVICQHLSSPCPEYFRYENNGFETYGIIEVPSIKLGQSLKIRIKLSLRADVQNNYYGSLETLGSQDVALQNITSGRNILYKVNFPTQEPLPKLTQILYNDQLICSGPAEQASYRQGVTTIDLERTLITSVVREEVINKGVQIPLKTGRRIVYPEQPYQIEPGWMIPVPTYLQPNVSIESNRIPSTRTIEMYRPPTTTTESTFTVNDDSCGKPILSGNPLVFQGRPTSRGEFPWLVVMYVKHNRNLNFTCSGSLISDTVVLTAAHCIHLDSGDKLTKEAIVLHIGQYNIDDWSEEGYVTPVIRNIAVHPDYKRFNITSYDADIALITLRKSITYTQYIRPVCLWQETTVRTEVISQKGVVVGWGRDENGFATSTPNKVEMPIVSNRTCLDSHKSFEYYISPRTFCAGNQDGSGPCNGDSGGPFTIYKNGRWYLKGIVSLGLYDAETKSCDLRNFVVFTDVFKFIDWIETYL